MKKDLKKLVSRSVSGKAEQMVSDALTTLELDQLALVKGGLGGAITIRHEIM